MYGIRDLNLRSFGTWKEVSGCRNWDSELSVGLWELVCKVSMHLGLGFACLSPQSMQNNGLFSLNGFGVSTLSTLGA